MRTAPVLAATVLTLATGLVHGMRTNRWGDSRAIEGAVARLDQVPMVIGDWRGQAMEIGRKEIELAEADGALVRRFVNPKGQEIAILLICGRPGPITTHTPDICYVGAGYAMVSPPVRRAIPLSAPTGTAAAIQSARFQKTDVIATYLRIGWAWSDGSGWKAPSYPRLKFVSSPVLYKLYVLRKLDTIDTSWDQDPIRAFLPQLLPALDQALFPGQRRAGPAGSDGGT